MGKEEERKEEMKGGVWSEKPACDNHHPFNKHSLSTHYMPGTVLVLMEQI